MGHAQARSNRRQAVPRVASRVEVVTKLRRGQHRCEKYTLAPEGL